MFDPVTCGAGINIIFTVEGKDKEKITIWGAPKSVSSLKPGVPSCCQGCSLGGAKKWTLYLGLIAERAGFTQQKTNSSTPKPTIRVLNFISPYLLCKNLKKNFFFKGMEILLKGAVCKKLRAKNELQELLSDL